MAFKSVRALERGLDALLAINQRSTANISELAKMTGVPRPTMYRLLETLQSQGYITQSPTDDLWHPTLKTKALSSGFREEDWVARQAVPHMIDLGKELLWPLDLVTFQNFEMVVRESTHSLSPFSIDHGVVGQTLPLIETSGGRCYLAFCSDAERAFIIDGLRKTGRLTDGYLQNSSNLDFILSQVRDFGLAFRQEGFRKHTMSISAPILAGDRVIACLTLIVITSAMSFKELLDKFSNQILETADKISKEVEKGSR